MEAVNSDGMVGSPREIQVTTLESVPEAAPVLSTCDLKAANSTHFKYIFQLKPSFRGVQTFGNCGTVVLADKLTLFLFSISSRLLIGNQYEGVK